MGKKAQEVSKIGLEEGELPSGANVCLSKDGQDTPL